MCSKHVQTWNKLIIKQKFCASSWLITEIYILRCTVSKTSKFHALVFPPFGQLKTIVNILAQWVLFCACSNQQTSNCVLHHMTTSSFINENSTCGLHSLPVCARDCHMNLTMQYVSRAQHFMAGDIYVWQAVLASPHWGVNTLVNNLHMCARFMLIQIIFLNIAQG